MVRTHAVGSETHPDVEVGMKKIVAILIMCVCAAAVSAQNPRKSVGVSDIKFTRLDDTVAVSFMLNAGKRSTSGERDLIVRPVLVHGDMQLELRSVTIRGWRMKAIEKRYAMTAGRKAEPSKDWVMEAGRSFRYGIAMPWEPWMSGADLVLRGATVGDGRTVATNIGTAASNVLSQEQHVDMVAVEDPTPVQTTITTRMTVGEQMSERYNFIAPVSELGRMAELVRVPTPRTYEEWFKQSDQSTMSLNPQGEVIREIFGEERKGSVPIYFEVGSSRLDRNYMSNNASLVELVSAVRALDNANGAKVVAVVIAGFASPEGKVDANDKLAWDRAMVVRSFLLSNTGIDPAVLRVYNGRADWIGLRRAVSQSDMSSRNAIMNIIDTVPIWDGEQQVGRLGELMRLNRGNPYKYMRDHIFPELRSAAYIKVFYEE